MATTLKNRFFDLDLNFLEHPATGDIVKLKDERAITTAIKNLLFTNFYERKFNPSLGSNINDMLFEPMDTATTNSIRQEIKNVIDNFEPRVDLRAVQVYPDFDNNRYEVSIVYFIKNYAEPTETSFFLQRVR